MKTKQTFQEKTDEINSLISTYAASLKKEPICISDREMQTITDLFYRRDYRVDTDGHSEEGLTFQRGMYLGMVLYRQILENSQI